MAQPSASKPPNFVLFITDQQRADHLGCYGNPVVRTPHLDALAARGWRAERCHVASPICMPNRASLLTGRLPSVHGARHNGIPLPLSETTFVERLREAGYRTALVGKGHLQNITGAPAVWPRPTDPRTQGEARRAEPGRFDQESEPLWRADPSFEMDLPYYGYDRVDLAINHGDTAGGHYRRWLEREHPAVAALTGPDQALPTPDYELARCRQAWRSRVPEELSTTSWVADRSCDFIADAARAGQPFFVQCSFPDPHHPFTPPGRFWDMFRPDDMALPPSYHLPKSGQVPHRDWLLAERDAGRALKHTPAPFAATEREVREALALTYGSIAHLDDRVGRVLQQIEALGLADDTVVLFTSDHGDFYGDHQLLWKGPLHYQGVIRVPLIWADPQAGATGSSPELCSTLDIAPTILARAGLVPHNGIQGRSLLNNIAQPDQPLGRPGILIEEEGQRVMFGFGGRVRMRSWQTVRHRLSVYEGVDWGELYDLQQDPDECHNLWDDPAAWVLRDDLLQQMVRAMIGYADSSPHPTAIA